MAMQVKAPHPIVAAVVAVLMLGGLGYALYHFLVEAPQDQQRLERTLFDPYFKALAEGRIDEAWQSYTTARYKRKYPLATYRQHWQRTFERKGRLARPELRVANEGAEFNNAINRAVKDENNPDRLIRTFAVSYALHFDHDFDLINYRVVRDVDGKERINDAGHHVPGWSYDAAEPW